MHEVMRCYSYSTEIERSFIIVHALMQMEKVRKATSIALIAFLGRKEALEKVLLTS